MLRRARAANLDAVRPLLLYIAVPGLTLFCSLEFLRGHGSIWVGVELAAALGMGLLEVVGGGRVRALSLSVGLTTVAAMSMVHFGPMLGTGLIAACAVLCAAHFYGPRGGAGSVAALILAMGGTAWAASAGWYRPAHGPAEPLVWARLFVATSVGLSGFALVFHRIQLTIEQSLRESLEARAGRAIAEQQREQALKAAMAAQRLEAVGRLVAGVAHDFNNSLTVIRATFDELAEEQPGGGREELLAEGQSAVSAAASTARQLLGFARRNAEQAGHCEAGALLTRSGRSLRRVMPESIHFETRVQPGVVVPVAEAMLEQILLNLVVNARDAMKGSGTILFECRTRSDGSALLVVADDGPGMSSALRARIFEPFFTTKAADDGTGLGLAMVSGIVADAGGRIEVDSEIGRGTKFSITFPPYEPPQSRRAMASWTDETQASGARILVVEDQPEVRRAIVRSLRAAGHIVSVAASCLEAHEKIARHPFDLLCTDGLLSDGTAARIVEAFARARPGRPVLLCTGYVEEESLAGLAKSRLVTVLRKPFGTGELTRSVAERLQPSTDAGESASSDAHHASSRALGAVASPGWSDHD